MRGRVGITSGVEPPPNGEFGAPTDAVSNKAINHLPIQKLLGDILRIALPISSLILHVSQSMVAFNILINSLHVINNSLGHLWSVLFQG